ncbi:hypothetical protein [Clostridium autoethanogenum]|uniref:Holin n=1 Tax=Clostridium autoethanogenum DSM 10061 TaxID=1341692 RepID=A0ABM5NSF5_9CLOT|nr:hypothetical protein [Clostridium autoethanogenum]AGY75308.1 hypothetical protein CAETHG_1083 [Clostridium autoethanogenum DSM 10061]ALU35474.1 Hypothetical protein CLAU_1045 [Clostridium autoethanogenum DSM 10061]OVY48567.1 hypothetical protein WX72_00515 [Clostridium autoethanogenum]
MISVNDIVAIGGVLVGVIGGIFGLAPYLNKRNINVDKVLNTTEQVLTAAEPLIKISETFPALKPAGSLIDWMEQKAKAGVKAAEQLYHSGILQTDEDRFKAAQNTVYAALKEINVEPTMNQKKLISDFIQEAVNDLGHAIPTETEKNAQIQKVQQDLAEVQKENEKLKQKLANIQNTVTPVQKADTAAGGNVS